MKRPAVAGTLVALLIAGGGLMAVVGGSPFRGDVGDDAVVPASAPTRPRGTTPSTPVRSSLGPLDLAAQRYFDAVAARDAHAVAAAFAPDGLVVDVGREIRSRDEIRRRAADEVVDGVYTLLDHTPPHGRNHAAGPLPPRRHG
ncbi:hypothetical protein ACFUN7_27960 [Streptomyces sp. NPDC057236]|uniref:hypothetical protein n=1 Tax=Streptomyces sp. NPDC057236 TaxID=3346059 RepID=UPI003638B187